MFYIFEIKINTAEGTEYAVAISPLPLDDDRWMKVAIMFPTEQDAAGREAHKMEIEAMLVAGGGQVMRTLHSPEATTRN